MCEPVLDGRIAGCLRDQLERILLRLPAAQRQTLILAFFEGYTHSEIAARTGVPLGTVKTRIRKGLAKLRKLLADDDGRNVPPPAVRAPKVLRFAA
jgi:RNA polymerase sigma-70 factor (ECF subfamily)